MNKRTGLIFLTLIWIQHVFGQDKFEGFIKDGEGSIVIGATVILKGTQVHSISDLTGYFSLPVDEEFPVTIRISSVGFETQEIDIYELPQGPTEIILLNNNLMEQVVVTSRRREEVAQNIPVPVSVIGGARAEDAGAFNVNRLKELVPTVQLYSSNPRNTTLNIRGLGSTFGLTNDGIDPGVGFYVDGVYYARPAVTALDFVDVEQIEILRGPQGTLFGKNTTAGAFNITTRKPALTPDASLEISYGNYGFIQAKSSVNGPVGKKIAMRFSFSGTQRDGVLKHSLTGEPVNDMNNLGMRAQILWAASDKVEVIMAGDLSRQRPEGFAQVYAGVVQTLRPAYRQFSSIISDLDYVVPDPDPFDRKIDHDTPWRSGNDLGGISVNVDVRLGPGSLTSTTAWRYWKWDPSNDRDFTGLQALSLSQAPSLHQQWSQEVRYAGNFSKWLNGVVGIFVLGQDLKSDPFHTEESGRHQWRFVQSTTSPLWATPGLLDGYGIHTRNRLRSFGGAVFGQLDFAFTPELHLMPGIRYNYDYKYVDYVRNTYGGLPTDDPALIAIKNGVYSDQEFTTDTDESNFSGQITLSYRTSDRFNIFGNFSTSYKPVGVNLGGLPRANGETLTELAVIKPELVRHLEFGIKSMPTKTSTLNFILYRNNIKDYQTLVQTPDLSVNRGYLANAEKVSVMGAELDGNIRIGKQLNINGSLACTDGRYDSFTNAPPPLEETGGDTFKDISGSRLPGISRWAASLGGEIQSNEGNIFDQQGKFFLGADIYYRSSFSSSPSPSKYLNIEGYMLVNARLGFRALDGWSFSLWGRNFLNARYFEMLLPGAGNIGHYAAVLGDPRMYGITWRYTF